MTFWFLTQHLFLKRLKDCLEKVAEKQWLDALAKLTLSKHQVGC
jgi:hypothetical protein